MLFLNYSAVDSTLTSEKCSFSHFRFDAHADMRLAALMEVLGPDKSVTSVSLMGQDYSFRQAVAREGRRQIIAQRPDISIVGDELHPLSCVKDFTPYAVKIKSSGAQAVLTGNWGNDLTLLAKAARDVGCDGKFCTFYGNALGVPAALPNAGLRKVIAVAEWFPNAPDAASAASYQSFRQRFLQPQDDCVHIRLQLMVEAPSQSMNKACSTDTLAVARQLGRSAVNLAGHHGSMLAADHQFQQPLQSTVMGKQGESGMVFDAEGLGCGFRVIRTLSAAKATQPISCAMQRP